MVRNKRTKWFNLYQVSLDIFALRSRSRPRLSGQGQNTPRVTAESWPHLTSHGQHTPRVTAQVGSTDRSTTLSHFLVPVRLSGHTLHTPRVTVVVPVSGHMLSGHTPHTPRVTVVVPVSHMLSGHTLHTPRVTVVVPVSSHTTVVKALRSWSCSHRLKVIPITRGLWDGRIKTLKVPDIKHSITSKKRNKLRKSINGNGKNFMLVAHWNLGSSKWKNKVNHIQALVDSTSPDLLFISEANLYEATAECETIIQGYNIHKPKTVSISNLSRLVLLSKDNLEINIESQLMDNTVASIWVKISKHGARRVLVGGIYREHRYLDQPTDISYQPAQQLSRWNTFLKQVEKASSTASCHVIGDVNMDFLRWMNPDQAHKNLVEITKSILETAGFSQVITGTTRAWPEQTSSLIDHIWSNSVQRILSWKNEPKAAGDHNMISAVIRIKGNDSRRLDTRKRIYSKFDSTIYRQILEGYDWNQVYEISNVDLASDFIISKIAETLDLLYPFKTKQYRSNYKPWISTETKEKIKERDAMWVQAKDSNDPASWKNYKSLRNLVTKNVDRDKKITTKNYIPTYRRTKTQGPYTVMPNFKLDGKQPLPLLVL